MAAMWVLDHEELPMPGVFRHPTTVDLGTLASYDLWYQLIQAENLGGCAVSKPDLKSLSAEQEIVLIAIGHWQCFADGITHAPSYRMRGKSTR
jgi:hypothetical protein